MGRQFLPNVAEAPQVLPPLAVGVGDGLPRTPFVEPGFPHQTLSPHRPRSGHEHTQQAVEPGQVSLFPRLLPLPPLRGEESR